MGEIDGREASLVARASAPAPDEVAGVGEPFSVSPDDLVVLARIASKAKVVRDCIGDRDARIAEAVQVDGIEVAAVARAAELTPAEVASIVFAQQANPNPLTKLRQSVRPDAARRAVPD